MKKQENKKIYSGDQPGTDLPANATPPPLKEQVINFAKSFGTWIKEGVPVVKPEEFVDRLAMCHACPSFEERMGRCNECGCMMEYKARMKTSECPLNKWKQTQDYGKK